MKKKILAVVLGLTLCFGITGCASSDDLVASNIPNADMEYKKKNKAQ